MDKLGHGIYKPMDVNLLPPLFLIYAENPSDSGKVHSTVRQRWLDGDEFIISSMNEVAQLAEKGKVVLLVKNYKELANLLNRNFDLRRHVNTFFYVRDSIYQTKNYLCGKLILIC